MTPRQNPTSATVGRERSKLMDLTDQRFGHRLVLGRWHPDVDVGGARWLCRCDCGLESIVPGQRLRSGLAQSCGCDPRRDDLTGQRFGRRVVLQRAKHPTQRGSFWLCRCDCGRESVVTSVTLRRSTSCGCKRRDEGCAWLIKHPAAVIAQIHELRRQGLGYDRISRALDVPKSTIRDVIKGLTRSDKGGT